MAGQSSGRSIESVRSDIHSVCEHSDTMYGEGSKIGGEGRMGGNPGEAPEKDVLSLWRGSGSAKRGETGYGSGSGKSL